MYKPGLTMKSKKLLMLAMQAFKANDPKRSGKLFAAAMNQRDSAQLFHELSAPRIESTSALPLNVGFNNEMMHDLDLPIGDTRTQTQVRLSDKYPRLDSQEYNPNNEPIPLVPATDGSTPYSGGFLEQDITYKDDDEEEIDEEMEDDPYHVPSSISKSLPLETRSSTVDEETYDGQYGIKRKKSVTAASVQKTRTVQRIVL